jgi:hypothetical protein
LWPIRQSAPAAPQREQLNVQVPQIKRGVALVFTDPGASLKMYLKNAFSSIMEGKLL